MVRTWLSCLRKSYSLTQAELASKCDVTRQIISSIEVGKRRPSVDLAKRIADSLQFDWAKFFEDEGEKAV